ncbi:VOC family protein [[Pseudomonas] boreopolis]|uniref:VOC family protein n=1 Tax=Xanthomonas boreopolis TaxID=86183 RepID=UPI003D9ADBE6
MRIVYLQQPTHDPAASAAFYRDVLQLPVEGTRVRIGWSEIELVPAQGVVGCTHLAFNVAPDRFEEAVRWIGERASILQDMRGTSRFPLARGWDSESVYFAGPDCAVLELIARKRLPAPAPVHGPFHGSELLCVSEVGLPSANVTGVTRSVGNHFRMQPLEEPTPVFAPLGDHEGLLIVVDHERRWFPEQKRLPWAQGVRVRVQGPPPGLCLYDAQGWELCSVA